MTRNTQKIVRAFVAIVALLPMIGNAQATDPSKGRLERAEKRAKLAKYEQCARFTLNNFNVCLRRAGVNQSQILHCRRAYRDYMKLCRKHLS